MKLLTRLRTAALTLRAVGTCAELIPNRTASKSNALLAHGSTN